MQSNTRVTGANLLYWSVLYCP